MISLNLSQHPRTIYLRYGVTQINVLRDLLFYAWDGVKLPP